MLDFVNDYSEGAHEKILQRLLETNMEKLSMGQINIVSQQNRKSGKPVNVQRQIFIF